MIRPPRTAELILESLGAQANLVEPVLGDLAEEFAARAERVDVRAARRWYYRESLRVAPHLLRAWAQRLRARDLRRLVGIVVASYVFTLVLGSLFVMMARGVADAVGFTTAIPPHTTPAVALLAAVMCALCGGYIAAWLDTRAPLLSAIVLGAAWSCAGVVMAIVSGGRTPAAYRVCLPAIFLVGPILGGLLRMRALAGVTPEESITS